MLRYFINACIFLLCSLIVCYFINAYIFLVLNYTFNFIEMFLVSFIGFLYVYGFLMSIIL